MHKKNVLNYDYFSSFHRLVAEQLSVFMLENLSSNFARITEIGCGTGVLTEILWNKGLLSDSISIISDISEHMVNLCKQKMNSNPLLNFCVLDGFHSYYLNCELLISSMVLHWFDDILFFLEKCIVRNKVLCFAIPINGSLSEWSDFCRKNGIQVGIIEFPCMNEIKSVFHNVNIKSHSQRITLDCKTVYDFLMFLRYTGPSRACHGYSSQNFLSCLKQHISVSFDIGYFIMYK